MLRDLIALPDTSRVWIYQADSPFKEAQKEQVRSKIRLFVNNWQSHGIPVESYGNLFHQQFVVLVANEDGHGVSGCSIDSSVKLIKEIEVEFSKDLFNRMLFAYMDENEHVHTVNQMEFKSLYDLGKIHDQTLVFNNLVKNKASFLSNWIVELKDSWHKRFV